MRHVLIIFLSLLAKVTFGQVVLDELPDQEIGREGTFAPLVLDNFTTNDVFWEVSFVNPEIEEPAPDWAVNSSSYQFEMNLTATVKSKGRNVVGNSHILAVKDAQGVVRSVGSAIQVQDDWQYFLTVYSNQSTEELSFEFFDHTISQVVKSNQVLNFQANGIVGAPDDTYQVEVGNIAFDLEDGVLSFEIINSDFIGTEKIHVIARSLADPTDLASRFFSLTVSDDYTPVVEGIPDQTTNFGEAFSTFDLDEFTSLQDNDLVNFTYDGNSQLEVAINEDNVVTVTKPTDWAGTETIIFTVTDQTTSGFNSKQAVSFKGKPTDQAPAISALDDQATGIGGFFDAVKLEEIVTASNPEAVEWEIEFLTDSVVAMPDWTVNSSDFQFDMSLTAKVTALGKTLSGEGNKLAAISSTEGKVVGMAEAVEVEGDWYFFLTINSNTDNDSIYFEVYEKTSQRILPTEAHVKFKANHIEGDPVEPFDIEAGYIFPKIENSELRFSLRQAPWDGEEIIQLRAIDTATAQQLSDSETMTLKVINLIPPVLEGISDQIIDEGLSFNMIDLRDFLKNISFEEVSVELFGAEILNPVLDGSILSFTLPSDDYFGEEELEIKVKSLAHEDLVDIASMLLVVNNVNDVPVISTAPTTVASIQNLYQYNFLASDADNDDLTVTVDDLPSWLFFVPNSSGATLLGIPGEADAGEHSFNVSVSDGQSVMDQQIDIVVSLARIEPIDALSIDEGASFNTIDLDNYLTVFGQISTYWEVSGAIQLTVDLDDQNVLTVQTPDENWFGTEKLTVKLFDSSDDSLLDEIQLEYNVNNINDAPEFISDPSASFDANAEEQYRVKTLVTDMDGDNISFSLVNAPDWITLFTEVDGFTLFGIPDLKSETYTFEVVADDGTTQSSIQVQIVVSYILGIKDVNDKIIIYPNPTSDYLKIDSELTVSELIILDQSGRQLRSFPARQKKLDVSFLKNGIYFIKVGNEQVLRFLKY